MSDDELSENSYWLIQSTLDLLDYLPAPNAKIYVASYVAQTHDEEERPRRYDFATHKVEEGPAKKVTKPGRWITLPGEKKKRLIKFAIEYDERPLPQAAYETIVDGDGERYLANIERGWTASNKIKRAPFFTVARFADPIYDDIAELKACDFPWAHAVGSLSEELRRDLFERNLHEQKEMPQGVATDGRTWLKQLATYCTYDSDGNYYNKWAAGKPGPKRKHTERYLEAVSANKQEVMLLKGRPYVIVFREQLGVAYSIIADENGIATRLVPHRMSGGLLWTMPSFQQNLTTPFDVYFVATLDGAKEESKPGRKAGYHLQKGDQASHEVVDARKLVAAAIGDDQLQHLNLAEDDEWGWFLQLCAHIFPHQYYALDVAEAQANPWVKQFGGIEKVREETNAFIEKAWKASPEDGKPLTAAARRIMRERMKDERTLIIPQGFPTSKTTRYIGTDGHYSFDRDINNGFIYVMPNVEYIGGLAQQKFFRDLYSDLAWLIPMMEGAAYLAAIFVGGGYAMTARKFVIRQVGKRAAQEIIREAVKAVTPALIALVADVLLEGITKPVIHHYKKLQSSDSSIDWDVTEDYIERWQKFLEGFIDGYIRLNIEGRVAKLHDIVMPTEAKAVLIATRLYELVERVRGFLERIQGVLTDGALAKLLYNLEHSSTHLVRGLASVLGLLYYLDYEAVKPWLEIFDADEKAPDPDQWAEETHNFFATMTSHLETAGSEIESVREFLDFDSKKPFVIAAAIGLGYTSFLTTALKTTGHHKKVYAALGIIALIVIAKNGKLDETLGVAKELVLDLKTLVPGKDKQSATVNGQLVGNVAATFLVDRALLGEKSTLGKRFKKRPMLRIAVEGSLGGSLIGNVVKMLLHRYIALAAKVSAKVKFVHDDIKAFLQDQRNDKRSDLDKAGLGRLNAFHAKSDDVISFREMVSILVHLRDRMLEDKEALIASIQGGMEELNDDFKALNKATTAAGFDLEKLSEREVRALMIQMNAHVYTALSEVLKAVDWLFAEVADEYSIMSILQEWGVDVGDLAKAHQSIRKAIEPKMEGFKKREEKLKEEQDQADGKKPIEAKALRQ